MRIVKPILVGLLTISIVLLGISSLFPSEVMTSKWVMVPGDEARARAEIRDLKGWPSWNLLLTDVSGLQVDPAPSPAETGGSIRWTDARGGRNSLLVTQNNDKGLVTTMTLGRQRPFESGFSVQKSQTDSVQVVWFIIERMRWYPWEKFYGMMAADMKGPLMQSSLERLREKMGSAR